MCIRDSCIQAYRTDLAFYTNGRSVCPVSYTHLRDGVYWSEKERVIAALNIGEGKSIKLNEESIGGPYGGASAEAWLCEKCKKIVIEY